MEGGKFNQIDGPEAFQAAFGVSRETLDKLTIYEAVLRRWQKTINLVAPSTLDHVWHRHFADSAQLWPLFADDAGFLAAPHPLPIKGSDGERELIFPSPRPGERVPVDAKHRFAMTGLVRGRDDERGEAGEVTGSSRSPLHILDLGAGAGFPGMVLAILGSENAATRHTLIESDSRKAAFLAEVARQTGVAVDILCARIELPATSAKVGLVDCITARALAPLPRLVDLAAPYFASHTIGLFSKGREVAAELEETGLRWVFESKLHPSLTDPSGSVVLLTALKVKTEG